MISNPISNAVRFLSADAVQKAKSGHPGAPMGMADIANVLWRKYLKHNPLNPNWMNRDRFILSNGHGSMLLYSLLHLTGYKISMKDIMSFRQLHSITPGHPECDITPGVETTTGPLGQGLANGVGMAIAEKSLADEFNKPGLNIIDHRTFVFAGDGCLMEGISHEACSLAGTLSLSKLIVFYDMNNISIDGDTSLAFTENVYTRFKSYGWNVINNIDGHNIQQIDKSIKAAMREKNKPTLLCMKTKIGFGSPNKQGTASVHGAPLGDEELSLARQNLKWNFKPFVIPKEIYDKWDCKIKGSRLEKNWNQMFNSYKKKYPKQFSELQRRKKSRIKSSIPKILMNFKVDKDKSIATRKCSQMVLERIGEHVPELIGGSADLKDSNLAYWSKSLPFMAKSYSGKYLHYGVREFAMSAISNGISLYGGFRPYASTFLIFSEYAKNGIRMSSIMHQPVIYIFTHDSIGLGEDGPTHQAVEQMNSLRLIPKMSLWRPADLTETAVSWNMMLHKQDGPSSIVLSRQSLPQIHRTEQQKKNITRGGYIIFEPKNKLNGIIISTGSELYISINAAKELEKDKIFVRVVSMPCIETFLTQSKSYRNKVLTDTKNILAVEAGVGDCWDKFIGKDGDKVVMTTFGLSAPGDDVMSYFGFSSKNIISRMKKLINKNRKK